MEATSVAWLKPYLHCIELSIVRSLPQLLKVWRIRSPSFPLVAGLLKKPISSGHMELNMTRPTVVRMTFPWIPEEGIFILVIGVYEIDPVVLAKHTVSFHNMTSSRLARKHAITASFETRVRQWDPGNICEDENRLSAEGGKYCVSPSWGFNPMR